MQAKEINLRCAGCRNPHLFATEHPHGSRGREHMRYARRSRPRKEHGCLPPAVILEIETGNCQPWQLLRSGYILSPNSRSQLNAMTGMSTCVVPGTESRPRAESRNRGNARNMAPEWPPKLPLCRILCGREK